MSSTPPTPPGVPPQQPQWPHHPAAAPPRESRGVAFFVAIFLGILLIASAGLNVLLLFLSVGSFAGSGLGIGDTDSGIYDEVYVAGKRSGRNKILQVPIRGAIAEGASPLLGAAGGSVTQVRRALRRADEGDYLGVLLYVDSPGGGVTDSDRIYKLLRRFRERTDKPVLALFGDTAASGGYYVAAAADHIVARPTSITGSIGVIMSAWNIAKAAEEWGIEQIAIKSERTPYKDMLSLTRPVTTDERAMLTSIVDELLDQFVDVVDEGRDELDRDGVLRAATGAIFTARQAKELKLIDEIGDYEAALDWFERRLDLGSDKRLTVVERRRRPSFSDLLLGARAPAASNPVDRLLTSVTGPRFLYFWQGGR